MIPRIANFYLAIELTEPSRSALLKAQPPMHERVIAHHVTLAFNPTERDLQAFPEGREIKLTVYASGADEKAQAVRVMLDENALRPDGKHYHITVSVSKLGKPVDSNKIEFFMPLQAYELTGVVKLIQK